VMEDPTTQQAQARSAVPDADAVMARAGGENFPVAPRWLPVPHRAHLLAIYGFARLTDELGDSAPGDRLAALDWLELELEAAYSGTPEHELMRELAKTIAACDLPPEPFLRLIEANRSDQVVRSYERWRDLMDYCALSANPVGELVLRVFGLASAERIRQSDAVCSALQVVEHCQDIREISRADASTYPRRPGPPSLQPRGHRGAERFARAARRARARVHAGVGPARRGPPLIASLRGWPRVAVAGYVGGGRAALSALARANFEVLALTPLPSTRRVIGSILRALAGARR